MISPLLQVALGGAIGSALRFLAVQAVGAPLATVFVNVLGSFAMGLAVVLLATRLQAAPFVMAGVLGGFTTFSAFSLDAVTLWQRGALGQAAAYVGGSVALSLAALVAGVALGRALA